MTPVDDDERKADDSVSAARDGKRKARGSRSANPLLTAVLIAVLLSVLTFWGYREWKLRRTHAVIYRALSDDTCRVRVQFTPERTVDPLEKQTGALTPWQTESRLTQETEATMLIYGDASCGAIRCEIEVDGVVLSRKTTQTRGENGIDSASCRALAVDVEH